VQATVTAADPNNQNDFDDRDGKFRALKGMAKNWRKDVKDYAGRVADYLRTKTRSDERWLLDQFENPRAIAIELRVKPKHPTRLAFLDGWLITFVDSPATAHPVAYFQATLEDARRYAERWEK